MHISRLDYGNAVLCGILILTVACLQRVQSRAAVLITSTNRSDHITPTLKEFHCLLIEYRIKCKILLSVYKVINGLAPSYLSDLSVIYLPDPFLRSKENNLLTVSRSRTVTYGTVCFKSAASRVWNVLPVRCAQARRI